jgi:hypothetical protein
MADHSDDTTLCRDGTAVCDQRDQLLAGMASFKPVKIDVPGVTATFLDAGGRGTNFSGFARSTEHGVSIGGTVDGPRIADPKGATTALLRLVMSRI